MFSSVECYREKKYLWWCVNHVDKDGYTLKMWIYSNEMKAIEKAEFVAKEYETDVKYFSKIN